jgi:hypothetical protein
MKLLRMGAAEAKALIGVAGRVSWWGIDNAAAGGVSVRMPVLDASTPLKRDARRRIE